MVEEPALPPGDNPPAELAAPTAESGRRWLLPAGIVTIAVISAVAIVFIMPGTTGNKLSTEQIMKMLPQSTTWFTYYDTQTMRGIASLQELSNEITSSLSHVADPNSIDFMMRTDTLFIFGGRFDFETIKNTVGTYATEEYKGYQIFGYTGYVTSSKGSQVELAQNYNSGLVLIEDKIVFGNIETVREFIDVSKGDANSMYENAAYSEVVSEITNGFIISVGESLLSVFDESIRGYSVDETSAGMVTVKAMYVFNDNDAAAGVLENIENKVKTCWTAGGSAIIEQKGKAVLVTITLHPLNVGDLLGWVTGSTMTSVQLTFQNSVSWGAVREDNGDITVSYYDTTTNTISANVKIENLDNQIENETNFSNTSTFSFTWSDAENSVAYAVVLTVQHEIFGAVSETKYV